MDSRKQVAQDRQQEATFDFESESVTLLGSQAPSAPAKKPVVRRGPRTIKWNSSHLPITAWGGNNPLSAMPGDGALQ